MFCLFFLHMAFIKSQVIYCSYSIAIPPSPLFFSWLKVLEYVLFILNAKRRKQSISYKKDVNFMLSLGQATVLAMSCPRTKKDGKSCSLHAHIIWITQNIPLRATRQHGRSGLVRLVVARGGCCLPHVEGCGVSFFNLLKIRDQGNKDQTYCESQLSPCCSLAPVLLSATGEIHRQKKPHRVPYTVKLDYLDNCFSQNGFILII